MPIRRTESSHDIKRTKTDVMNGVEVLVILGAPGQSGRVEEKGDYS